MVGKVIFNSKQSFLKLAAGGWGVRGVAIRIEPITSYIHRVQPVIVANRQTSCLSGLRQLWMAYNRRCGWGTESPIGRGQLIEYWQILMRVYVIIERRLQHTILW